MYSTVAADCARHGTGGPPACFKQGVATLSRRVILLTVAVLVAAAGTFLVFLYVQGADTRAEDRFETVDVLTAVAPIEAGETIDSAQAAGKLQLAPVAQDDLLPGYQTGTENLAGLVATTRIFPGEQIISDKFGGADRRGPVRAHHPQGQRRDLGEPHRPRAASPAS